MSLLQRRHPVASPAASPEPDGHGAPRDTWPVQGVAPLALLLPWLPGEGGHEDGRGVRGEGDLGKVVERREDEDVLDLAECGEMLLQLLLGDGLVIEGNKEPRMRPGSRITGDRGWQKKAGRQRSQGNCL